MNEKKLSERNSALDIIRIFAVFSVVSVHFFLNINFYAVHLEGPLMYFMTCARTFFNVCVPLFIILTGYLMCNKSLSKSYYRGISKTLIVYILAAIACIVFRAIKLDEVFTFKSAFIAILDFSGANYSWYIEMYVGLFLIAPFLNLAYNNLKNQRQKQVLVFTFAALTILPSLFNIYNFDNPNWWLEPTNENFATIYNNWWTGSYPLAYYFLGCYFREYGMKIKTGTLAISVVGFTLLFGSFNFYRCHGSGYQSSSYGFWNGFEAYVLSALFFVLLSRIKTENYGPKLKWSLWKISDLALGIYLLSYIFDKLTYPLLTEKVVDIKSRFPYYFIMVPVVFFLSAIGSFVANFIATLILQGYDKLKTFIKTQKEKDNKMLWQDVLFAILLVVGLILAFWKCVYGFGGNDEAFYLTVPHRLSLGDALIKDEWHLSQLSGVLLYPFVSLYTLIVGSTEGIMLTARVVYVILHAVVSVVLYSRLRKYGIMSVFATALYFVYTPYNIMAYSYNTMGLDFVTLTGVLLGTAGYKKPLPIIISGVTFACAVLCSPYLAVAYIIFGLCVGVHYLIKKKSRNCVFSTEMFSLKTFLWFTAGAGIIAVLFLIFALSRVSISEVFEYLPYLMTDPEHPQIPVLTRLGSYFRSIYTFQEHFKYPLIAYGVLLLIMIIDRKRRQHRSLYLLGTIGVMIVAYVLVFSALTTKYYNAIMMPMFFIGLTSYILIKNKPRTLLASLFALGILYSLAITFASNQYHYVIFMALTASNIASFVFLSVLIKEMRETEDNLDYAVFLKYSAFTMVAFVIFLQGAFQINAKVVHVFWESGTASLTSKISQGPAKGIYTTPDKCAEYEQIYSDLQYYHTKSNDTILCLTNRTWTYLALNDFEYGTLSAWVSGETDNSIIRLKTYYQVNPEKQPKYIYIPKASEWDFTNLYSEANQAGYNILENSISYKLERVE